MFVAVVNRKRQSLGINCRADGTGCGTLRCRPWGSIQEMLMRSPVALPLFIAILLSQPAAAQVRPAGTNSSVTTGIGSSSSVTTHPPLPGTNTTTNATPIPGLFPYVPDDRDKSDQAGPAVEDLEHAKPKGAAKPAPRSEY